MVNNHSTDNTAKVAQAAGAIVLLEERKGYGYACLKGLAHLRKNNQPDIVVFLDGDYSDYPEELTHLVQPIIEKSVDFVVGARTKELREKGSMTPQQVLKRIGLFFNACTVSFKVYRFRPVSRYSMGNT